MTSNSPQADGYTACLLPASGIGAASRWIVPFGEEGYQPYLVLTFRIGPDTFHRVWAYHREVAGEASYAFLGDTSVSFPGMVAAGLQGVARKALQLDPALRSDERPRRDSRPSHARPVVASGPIPA